EEQYVVEAIRADLLSLPSEARPVLLLFNIDCVWKTQAELDPCFAVLRGLLDATQMLCFVTATEEIPISRSPGTSHFANNFSRRSPMPVKRDELAAAWHSGGASFLNGDRVAELVGDAFGFAEGRVQQGLRWLSLQGDVPAAELGVQLRALAVETGTRDAEVFWDRLTESSRDVLCASAVGTD